MERKKNQKFIIQSFSFIVDNISFYFDDNNHHDDVDDDDDNDVFCDEKDIQFDKFFPPPSSFSEVFI